MSNESCVKVSSSVSWLCSSVNVCVSPYFFRLAAAAEARASAGVSGEGAGRLGRPPSYGAMGGKKGPPPQAGAKGPSSLFILSDDNVLRKYTRFIIEWPYPFMLRHFFIPLYNCYTNIITIHSNVYGYILTIYRQTQMFTKCYQVSIKHKTFYFVVNEELKQYNTVITWQCINSNIVNGLSIQ